jgi:hypothetical protein
MFRSEPSYPAGSADPGRPDIEGAESPLLVL